MKMCEVWKRFCAKASKWVWVRSFITCECGLCRGMLKWQKMGRGCVTLSPGIPWKLRFLRSPHPFPKRPHFVNFLSGNFLAKNWARLIGTFFFLRFHQKNWVVRKSIPFPPPFLSLPLPSRGPPSPLLWILKMVKFSDPFTKLNLSPSLDRANLNAYNPWEIVSRLQTIQRIFNLTSTLQLVFLCPKDIVSVPSTWRNSLAGIVVWIQLGFRFRGFQPYA